MFLYSRGRAVRWLVLPVATVVIAAVSAACSSGGDQAGTALPVYDVTLTADAVQPASLELRVSEKASVVVTNESDTPCAFHFGPYVQDLVVPAHDDASIAFTATDTTGTSSSMTEASLAMGCSNDGRTGQIVLLQSTADR